MNTRFPSGVGPRPIVRKKRKSNLNSILRLLAGGVLIVAGVFLGIYLCLVVLFVGGLVEAVNAVKATPVATGALVWGLVKAFVLAGPLFTMSFWGGVLGGIGLIGSA